MKNKVIQFIVLFCSTLFVGNSVSAQNAKEVLKKLNATYANKSYQMNYSVKTMSEESNNPVNKYAGMIAKEGRKLYLNTSEELTIVNDDYHVYVNKLEKVIFVNEVPKEQGNQAFDPLSNLDSILNRNKNIKLISSTNSYYAIEILLSESEAYEKVVFKVNKNYQLIGCTYFLSGDSYPFDKIDIVYSNISVGKKMNKKLFSTKDVFKRIKHKLVPVSAYKTYNLIDNRDKKS